MIINTPQIPTGKTRGRTPFGYSRERGELIPNKAEQQIIDEMIARRERGQNIHEISKALEQRGARLSPSGVAIVLFEHWGRRPAKPSLPLPPLPPSRVAKPSEPVEA